MKQQADIVKQQAEIVKINVGEYRGVIKHGQSKETGNVGYNRRRKTKQKQHNICWTPLLYTCISIISVFRTMQRGWSFFLIFLLFSDFFP